MKNQPAPQHLPYGVLDVEERRHLEELATKERHVLVESFTDNTIVGGRRWGDLPLQDRKAYLAGGYPF